MGRGGWGSLPKFFATFSNLDPGLKSLVILLLLIAIVDDTLRVVGVADVDEEHGK